MNNRSQQNNNVQRRKNAKEVSNTRLKKFLEKIKLSRKSNKVIIVGIIILTIIVMFSNYISLGLIFKRNISEEDAVILDLKNTDSKIVSYDDEILVYDKGRLCSYNKNGKNTWNTTIEGVIDANIITAGKYIQITNKDKGIVYIFKNKYETARIKIDGNIKSSSINNMGMSIVEYSLSGNKTILGIYDYKGNLKYNVKLSSRMIGRYCLSDDSKQLAYVEIITTGISVSTNINVIDLKSSKDDTVVYTSENSLIYDIYWYGKNVIARLDNKYVIYDTKANEIKEIALDNVSIMTLDEFNNRYSFIQMDDLGKYQVYISKFDSDKYKLINLDDFPRLYTYKNSLVYVCYQKKLSVFNNSGMNIKNFNSNNTITNFVPFNDGKSIALTINNKLVLFTI